MKLGDLIERITYYTGIKWLVKKVFGNNCGCDERQNNLNDIELWQKKNKLQEKEQQNLYY